MSGLGGGLSGSFAEQKLKSFSIGAMGNRPLTKKEQEEARKKAEADEVGRVYKEFVSTFADDGGTASKVSKTWVKAGTFNAGNRKEDTTIILLRPNLSDSRPTTMEPSILLAMYTELDRERR